MRLSGIVASGCAIFVALTASAYDNKVVHPTMTVRGFELAESQTKFLERFGLSLSTKFNGNDIPTIGAKGAEAEDDGDRPLNHFYDPVHESALVFDNPELACIGHPAGDFTARQWATATPANTWGLAAAKENLRGMLTNPTATGRDLLAVALFQSLGHEMHLVQDMAQPQHTRNDAHPTSDDISCLTDPDKCWLNELNLWSRYEKWCQNNLNVNTNPPSAAIYDGYPLVGLDSNGSYFKSGDGRGLAEYANRNFVTEHTNYSDPFCDPYYFADPSQAAATPREEVHNIVTTTYSPDGSANIDVVAYDDTVLSFPVYDAYTNSTTINPNHSFQSAYDYDLKKAGKQPVWSLPESALAAQASLLVPRAVGYSAGFLAHFFRGQIDMTWTKNPNGTYNATLKNNSQESLGNIHLTALYRVQPGTHGAPAGQDLVTIIDQSLDPALVLLQGEQTTLSSLTVSGLQPNEDLKSFERRIAVTTTLGSEPGTVIGLVQPGSHQYQFVLDWQQGNPPGLIRLRVEESDLPHVLHEETWNSPCWVDAYRAEIPGSVVSPPGSKPLSVTFTPSGQPIVYIIDMYDCPSPAPPTVATPMTFKIFRDGTLVLERDVTINPPSQCAPGTGPFCGNNFINGIFSP